ncbi:MAG: hypothetical protein AAGI36_20655 [Pseudomonadota bacterium]
MGRLGAAVFAAFVSTVQISSAAVIDGLVTSGVGEFEQIFDTSGLVVGQNNQQQNNLFSFNEKQAFVLDRDIDADIGGTISEGTKVSSHYVFFDPVRGVQTGYVDFDGAILGIITSLGKLIGTDDFGLDEVVYLSRRFRGLEGRDTVGIDESSPSRLLVDWRASNPGDYIRVITAVPIASAPLPASSLMLFGGVVILALAHHWRRRRRNTN